LNSEDYSSASDSSSDYGSESESETETDSDCTSESNSGPEFDSESDHDTELNVSWTYAIPKSMLGASTLEEHSKERCSGAWILQVVYGLHHIVAMA